MEKLPYHCRKCGKVTLQMIRVVTDNLPPNVHVLECCVCSNMGVSKLDENLIE